MKYVRAFAATLGCFAGLGFVVTARHFGVQDPTASFVGVICAIGTAIGVFFIEHW